MVLDTIMAIVSGGATGILGTVVSGVFKFMDRKAEAADRRDKLAHELKLHELQIQAGQAETENELRIAEATTSREQLLASYQHDISAGPGYKWVSAILRLVRPTLTFVLIGLTAWIYHGLEGTTISGGVQLEAYIINTIVYTTSAAVLWWFGDRATQIKK